MEENIKTLDAKELVIEDAPKTETSWYVASTQSGHENKVKQNLQAPRNCKRTRTRRIYQTNSGRGD